ncbi:MAG: HAMP domain-containing protein [Leptospira sp.]|nr:HAMP domain-containing protein [Leptospira sp.]NCS95645.1 HAMP domain-containing protein [Leptospira sp.]
MNANKNYIPLGSSGSIIFLESTIHSFPFSDAEKRRISFSTSFLGKSRNEFRTYYSFGSKNTNQLNIDTLQFEFPDPESNDSIAEIKSLANDLQKNLKGNNLVIFYNPEDEDRITEILYLLRLGASPFEVDDQDYPERIFQKSKKEWKQSFIQFGFNMFRQKIESEQFPNIEIIKKSDSMNNYQESLETTQAKGSDEIKIPNVSSNQIQSNVESNIEIQNSELPKPISIPSSKSTTNGTSEIPSEKKPEISIDHKVSELEAVKSNEKDNAAIEKNKTKEPNAEISNLESSKKNNAKFSIQIKMMGMISLILAITVSTIIALATYFFRDDSTSRIQENNLTIVDIIGLKISSDIQGIVSKAEQLVASNNKEISATEKAFITDLFFKNDKDFIFIGLFANDDGKLVSEKSFYNDEYLIQLAVSEEEIQRTIEINNDSLIKALTGNPEIINATPGLSKQAFMLALPVNLESGTPKLLVVMVRLDKISPAFKQKGINTTFMVNGEGKAIAHPIEDVVFSATSFIDSPIVKEMLTSQVDTGLKRYVNAEGSPFLGSYKRLGFGDSGIISIVSEDKALEAVYKIQEQNLYIMGISLCLGMIIVFFFAKSLSRPILSLLTATLEIAKGNFNIGIKPTTKDEVGLLTSYFITMGEGLEEREKVKSILGSMIDPVVVKEAMVDMAALKRGKESEITAFFSDVAGFSTISEQLTSVDLAALLNEYLSAMTILLKENEGVLDKYIGDAIVGIFGAPVTVENHAIKACKASIEMVMKLEDLRNYWQKNNLYSKEAQEMDARIGLNTGLAKVGFMGTDALASYTMMGDTVNLAARLEAAGKDYGVNVMLAEQTKLLVESEMFTRFLDLVRVKGKNEPVRVYELVNFNNNITQNQSDSVGLYQEGYSLYLNRNWDGAIRKFEESERAKGKKDKSSIMLVNRCQDYKSSPPPKDWDGVFTRTTK